MAYFSSIHSEWLKTRRSAASWLCLIGGFFIPIIYLILFLKDQTSISQVHVGNAWKMHFRDLWQNMSVFLLPMSLILTSSLVTQVEYRNNTWKQLHTTPQKYTTIFLAKFTVVMLMTFKLFIFFNLGILLTGYIPSLLFDHQLPDDPLPFGYILKENGKYFLACLPVMAIQFLVSLRFKNFLVPIGIGFLGLIGTLIGITWKYIVMSPFSYCVLRGLGFPSVYNLSLLAFIYFILILATSYILYVGRKEKG